MGLEFRWWGVGCNVVASREGCKAGRGLGELVGLHVLEAIAGAADIDAAAAQQSLNREATQSQDLRADVLMAEPAFSRLSVATRVAPGMTPSTFVSGA